MGILGLAFGFIYDSFRVYKFFAVSILDIIHCRPIGFIRNAERVRTDIGNQTYRAFSLHVNAFIKLLGNHHSFLCGHIQMLAGLLLQGAGGKGRYGLFLSAACFYLRYLKGFIL